jgi:CubicO group peptidase (beta-lactamase class C family)
MKSFVPIRYFSALIIILLFSCTVQKDKDHDPEWVTSIDQQVTEWYNSQSILGAELLIMQDNNIALHKVYGWDDPGDSIPLRKGQLFRIHSMTKPFTGTAVMILADEGKLKVTDRVSEYLRVYDNDACREITIEQLLNHTAGFRQPAYPRGSIDLYESLEEAVADLCMEGPRYEPGSEYHYSDGHSASLGLLVQEVSGMPAETFISKKIFAPLEMKNSFCGVEEEGLDRDLVCDTYYWRQGKYQKMWDNYDPPETPFFRASGGILTSTGDYARFLSTWMNGGEYNGHRLVSSSILENALSTDSIHPGYGLHWQIFHQGDDTTKLPVFGHGGSSGTLAMALPELNAMVFYFTQSRGTLTANFLPTLILEELGYIEGKKILEGKLGDSIYEKYTGSYKIGQETWQLERTGKGMCLKSWRLVPIEFLPVNDTVFVQRFMDMKIVFAQDGGKVPDHFLFNVEGREIMANRVAEDR